MLNSKRLVETKSSSLFRKFKWKGMGLCVASLFVLACAHTPPIPDAPDWLRQWKATGEPPAQDSSRLWVVGYGGPTGMPAGARQIAQDRAARDLASMLGTVSVAGVDISSRVTRSDQTTEGTVQRHFAVDRSESSRLFKSVLEGMKQEAEWIDPEGRWSGKEGRVYYFLYSYPKP